MVSNDKPVIFDLSNEIESYQNNNEETLSTTPIIIQNINNSNDTNKEYIIDPKRYRDLMSKTIESLKIIETAFSSYKIEEIAISFNGGKDCCVLLHLIHHVFLKESLNINSDKNNKSNSNCSKDNNNKHPGCNNCKNNINQENNNNHQQQLSTNNNNSESINNNNNNSNNTRSRSLRTLYFNLPNSFPQVDMFTEKCSKIYNLNLSYISSGIKEGLEDQVSKHNIKAIFVGIRHTDPYCQHLKPFSPTDPGWPPFIRVNPILEWDYNNIWDFIKLFNVPYCELYDEGYTSIGVTNDTIPNPNLKIPNTQDQYLPAYLLKDVDYK
eukprot:gene3163-3961_t